ncbi:MAG: HipA domain-containing protein [Verrucomicrobiales bacterium]|nr:HipA domain-containing protein [Verrucomicrobiales bacterium]
MIINPATGNRCLSTLRESSGKPYSRGAITQLWNGRKVSPVLDFDLPEFHRYRRENANRISISGVQDKVSVKIEGGKLVPTKKGGEYIIKPIPSTPGLVFQDQVPANEHITMQIASQVAGVSVPPNGLVFFPDGSPAYIVKRFDRNFLTGGKLHQEDFCQLSERTQTTHGRNYKYDGSYEEVGQILKKYCPSYAIEIEKLFRLILFNYLVGNGDAHFKNFSLSETPLGDFALSPAYDLLNTSLHIPTESRAALDLFSDDYEMDSFRKLGFYSAVDFKELAQRFGMKETRAQRMISELAGKEPDACELLDRSFLSSEAKSAYRTVIEDRFKAVEQGV